MNSTIPTPMRERIQIYGLFDRLSGICYYVGQTRCSHKRAQQHFHYLTERAKRVPNAEFRIIREVHATEDAAQVERQVIADYKARGEASLNSDKPPTNYRSSAYYFIHWIERDVVFAGFGETGRALGCTAQTIANHFKSGGRRIEFDEGVTLVLKTPDEISQRPNTALEPTPTAP